MKLEDFHWKIIHLTYQTIYNPTHWSLVEKDQLFKENVLGIFKRQPELLRLQYNRYLENFNGRINKETLMAEIIRVLPEYSLKLTLGNC